MINIQQRNSKDGYRFKIVRLLAEGGLGSVYVAQDKELGREVAVKTVKEPYANDAPSRKRFLLEGEITGLLEHPGIGPVYSMGHDAADRPYYAMRLVKGETLGESIRRFHLKNKPGSNPSPWESLTFRELLGRFIAVCNTVAYAHSRGVIHRDLKPDNVLLGPYGETLVADWGLAKVLGRNGVEHAGSSPSSDNIGEPALCPQAAGMAPTAGGGTPQYMSPEQADGGEIGASSDVYCLGTILYRILVGRSAFENDQYNVVLERVRAGDFPRPRHVRKDLPAALEAICLKGMSLRPEDRYPSARVLALEVERWLAGEPVSAYPEPFDDRARRWVSRHRTFVYVAVASLAIAALGLSFVAYDRTQSNKVLTVANGHAKTRYGLARDAIRRFHQGVSEELLLKEPGFEKLRARLLDSAHEFYSKLATDLEARDGLDGASAIDLALTYGELAAITEEIGQKTDALDAYRRAVKLLEPENLHAPLDFDTRLTLARFRQRAGHVLVPLPD